MTLIASLRKEVCEQWRTYRLLVVAVVLTAFAMLSPLTAKLMPQLFSMVPGGEQIASIMPQPTVLDAVGQYIKNTNQFAFLLALLIAMGAVAQEKERGTAALMLVKPLGRGTFLLAKFAAIAVTFLTAIALAAVVGYYYTAFIFESPDPVAWVVMNGLLWLYTLVFVAVTLLGSTLAKSQAAAVGLGFVAFLLLAALGALPTIGQYMPGQLVSWATSLFTAQPQTAFPALLISLGLIAACLLAACAVFKRQEI
jgi:ABC-2 type transport system permease protein